MPHDHYKAEVRYCVSPDAALPSFAELGGVAEVDPPGAQQLVADYFDTDDLRLAGLGIALCRRSGGDDAGWYLKVPHGDGRHELRVSATVEQAPPPAVRDALAGALRRRRLTPMMTITTIRTPLRLRDARGRELAVVSDDRVDARSPVPGVVAAAWREWSAGLPEGDADLLRQLRERFEQAGAAPASHTSKLAKALDDSLLPIVAEPRKRNRNHHSAHGVVRARLRDQVADLLRWDILVRADVEDSVHQMRVTVRRLRSALATYRPMFDRDRTDPLRAELKWLASLLGAARDAEVMHDRIGDLAAAEGPQLLDPRTISSAQDELTRRYRENHQHLLHELNSARYSTMVDQLERLIADTPWSPGTRGLKSGALRKRVRHDWKRVTAAVASADQAPDDETRLQRLHEARKAAKRARYAAEPLIPAHGADAKRFVKATKKVQTTLGELNDASLTMDELRNLAANETAHGHNAFTLGVLHAREQEDATRSEARFEQAWRKARRKKVLGWLR